MINKIIITFACFILITSFARAGIWEPDHSKVYSFKLNPIVMYELQEQDTLWIKSLLTNLQKQGSVKGHFVFVKTDLRLYLNDEPLPITVFVNMNDTKQFLAFEKDGQRFLIDFGKRIVNMPCCGGLSFHPNKSGHYIIIVDPVSEEIGGIPISSGGKEPVFQKETVTWY